MANEGEDGSLEFYHLFVNRALDTLSLIYMMLSEVGEVHERVLMHPRIQARYHFLLSKCMLFLGLYLR